MDRAGGVAVDEIIQWFAARKDAKVVLCDIMSVVSAEYLLVKTRKQRFGIYQDDDCCTWVRNANRMYVINLLLTP